MADPLGLDEVRRALAEDRACDDVTTRLLGTPGERIATSRFVAEGRFVVAGLPHQSTWIRIVALAAVALGTMNVVGGFVVTDRMLGMFRRRAPVRASGRVEEVRGNREVPPTGIEEQDEQE